MKKGGALMKCDCPAWMSWLVLIVGIIYVLADLNIVAWWNLNWWSVAFVLCGLVGVMKK